MSIEHFAGRLKELRTRAGMTQGELAAKAGIKVGAIRDLEQGRNGPTWETVLALAAALGVTCEAFTQEPTAEATEPRRPGRPRKDAAPEADAAGADDHQEEAEEDAPAEESPAPKKQRRKKGT